MNILAYAMGLADFNVIEALLDAGANPYLRVGSMGGDPLIWAAIMGRTENLRRWLLRFPRWDIGKLSLSPHATHPSRRTHYAPRLMSEAVARLRRVPLVLVHHVTPQVVTRQVALLLVAPTLTRQVEG